MDQSTLRFDSQAGYGQGESARLRALLDALTVFFSSRGMAAYLVGGVVRDAVIGRPTNDVDVAVDGNASAIGRELANILGGHLVPLDPERGIFRVALRREDGPVFVDISSIAGTILDDLRRRDFTVDAMALPVAQAADGMAAAAEDYPQITQISLIGKKDWDRRVIDPFGGLADARAKLIRRTSEGVLRDDPVRLVRAARLAAQLGFQVEAETAHQIRAEAHLVSRVAPERVREEFLKLLDQPRSTSALRLMDELGLLTQVVPELERARGVTQPREHYWDVFNHLMETPGQVERVVSAGAEVGDFVSEAVPRFSSFEEHFDEEVSDGHSRLTLLKLAGLLHDIGKPATRSVEESGRIRFFGHHLAGAEITRSILHRLRFSRRGVELVSAMVRHHLRPGQMAERGELPSGRAIYRYFRDVGDAAVDTLYLNLADYLAARGPMLEREDWERHCRVIGHILKEGLEEKAPEVLPKLLSGYDIMKAFDIGPGPRLGELLDMVREAQASGEVNTKEEALRLVRSVLEPGGTVA